MTKTVHIRPEIADQVLRDPIDPITLVPDTFLRDRRLSLGAIGMLGEILAAGDSFNVEEAREKELVRRASGTLPEDIDALLNELEGAGYITLSEV